MTSRLADDLKIVFEASYDPPHGDMLGTIRSALQAESWSASGRGFSRGTLRRLEKPAFGTSRHRDRRRPVLILQAIAVGFAVGVAVAGVVGGSLLLFHHSASAPAGHTTSPSPAGQQVLTGNVLTRITYPGTNAYLDPPGSLQPSLTATTVLGFCSPPQSTVTCETGPPKSVELGILADAGMGIHGELVWAMTWTGVGCDPMGPAGRPTPGTSVNDATGCDLVTFVDASTGNNPEAIRGPFGL